MELSEFDVHQLYDLHGLIFFDKLSGIRGFLSGDSVGGVGRAPLEIGGLSEAMFHALYEDLTGGFTTLVDASTNPL